RLLESVYQIPDNHLDPTDTGIEGAGQKNVRHLFGRQRHIAYSLRSAPDELHGAPPPGGVNLAQRQHDAWRQTETRKQAGIPPIVALVGVQVGDQMPTLLFGQIFCLRHELHGSLDQRLCLRPALSGLLLAVKPEHRKGDLRVLKCGARQQKLAPQLVIHRAVIVDVEPTDVQRQLTRKQHLRLHNVAALLGRAPDSANPHQIHEAVDATAMDVERATLFVDVDAVADIHDADIESDP